MGGRRDREQEGDHRLVPAYQRMADVPGMVGRPMPIEEIARWGLAIPVPLDPAPERRDRLADFALRRSIVVEIVPGREQPLHQKGGFNEIAAIIVTAEIG